MARGILEGIKDRYECDVFMGMDPSNTSQNAPLNSVLPTTDELIEEAVAFVEPKQTYMFDEVEYQKSVETFEFNMGKPTTFDTSKLQSTDLVTRTGHYWHVHKVFDDSKTPDYELTKMDPGGPYKNLFRQYFLLSKCYEMLRKHVEATGTHYDVIVRLRFDILLSPEGQPRPWEACGACIVSKRGDAWCPDNNTELVRSVCRNCNVQFIDQEPNTISLVGAGTHATYAYANEQFWTHGMDLIEPMSTFYKSMPDIISQCTREHAIANRGADIEHYFLRHLVNHGIRIKRSNLNAQFVRGLNV